jgi:hypothetical protein
VLATHPCWRPTVSSAASVKGVPAVAGAATRRGRLNAKAVEATSACSLSQLQCCTGSLPSQHPFADNCRSAEGLGAVMFVAARGWLDNLCAWKIFIVRVDGYATGATTEACSVQTRSSIVYLHLTGLLHGHKTQECGVNEKVASQLERSTGTWQTEGFCARTSTVVRELKYCCT